MANNYDIIRFRRGYRSELSNDLLQTGEPGFTTDTNQLFIGIDDAINEIQVDTFPNAHAVVQTWLDTYADLPGQPAKWAGLKVDEDLVIRDIPNDPTGNSYVDDVIADMQSAAPFGNFVRPRHNVEVITENTFHNLYADQQLSIYDLNDGRRSSLYRKTLDQGSGLFAVWREGVNITAPSAVYLDYTIKQTNVGTPEYLNAQQNNLPFAEITYVRVGTIKIINGYAFGLNEVKLTDGNTEIWQDDGDGVAEFGEFSSIRFEAELGSNGDLEMTYTQEPGFISTVTYTVKRWSM